jgi:3-oxoadipate enol-lactonase
MERVSPSIFSAMALLKGMGPVANTLVQTAVSTATRGTNPSLVPFLRESIMRQSVEGYARTCEALAGAMPADVDQIQCAALLITGDADQTAPLQQIVFWRRRSLGRDLSFYPVSRI